MTLMVLTERQIKELRAAGNLLESDASPNGKITITPKAGETYEHAVIDVVQSLSAAAKVKLRSHVDWVIDYDSFVRFVR